MKPLSKVNKTIKDLVEQVNEIEQYNVDADFNTRGGGYANSDCIVANIKVYDWLDSDDVSTVLNKVNYFKDFKIEIEEEFCNDDRLSSIHNHVCENEVRYLKEKYEELVHLNDYRERARVYAIYRAGNLTPSSQKYHTFYKIYKNEYDKFLKRKHNTHKDYFKWLYKNNKAEIDERDRLESFERECWQYGRSGGWLSICKRDELEDLEFESEHFYIDHNFIDLLDIEDNNSFNKLLNEDVEVYGTKNKNLLISELKTFIQDWEDKKDNIEFFVNEIEEGTKHFKNCLLSQLEHEIEQFLEDLNVDFFKRYNKRKRE